MAESSISSPTPFFTLGQELILPSFCDEQSDEEPVSKRLKLDSETNDSIDRHTNDKANDGNQPAVPLKSTEGEVVDAERPSLSGASNEQTGSASDESGEASEGEHEDQEEPENTIDQTKSQDAGPPRPLTKKKSKKDKLTRKKKKKKSSTMRKNIRDILDTTQLEAETLEAQREEQERRKRMNAKIQQLQQQNNLMKLLSAVPSSDYCGPNSENVERLFAQKGLGAQSVSSIPKIIDEVTLSSDEEPEGVTEPGRGLSSSCKFIPGFRSGSGNKFLSSGGTVLSPSAQDWTTDSSTGDKTELKKSAGYDSDSDDCVILSPTSYQDEAEKEEKDDEINIPDELGRVLVNVAHPPQDPDIFLAPQIANIIKPHQIGGIRFLYDNVVESLDRFNTSNGFGCILAHSMGLGKTIQAVSFCDVFLRFTPGKTVLIIVPINTIQNWLNEFNQWVPYKPESPSHSATETNSPAGQSSENLGSCGAAAIKSECSDGGDGNSTFRPRNFQVFLLNETVKTLKAREKIIREWKAKGGVLLLGYEMYRMLALKRLKRSAKKKMASLNEGDTQCLEEETSLANIYSDIVSPGPDLVICDEGHRIKNSGASISQALKAVRTKRRVVLTGYPLQNNLMEYWCMVDFVRPNYLGNKAEFSNMFERPITNGQCLDSSDSDKRLMRHRSHVLHTLLEGFVQRRSHTVLQSALPPKNEWVFLLKMTPIQYSLYKEFIRYLREDRSARNSDGSPSVNPIKAFAVCCKIWNHPDALYNVVKKHDDVLDDLDLEDVGPVEGSKKGARKPRKTAKQLKLEAQSKTLARCSNGDFYTPSTFDPSMINFDADSTANIPTTVSQCNSSSASDGRSISIDWAIPIFKDYQPEILQNGVKFQLLLAIIDEVEKINDKILVFSQSLLTLDLIELFISKLRGWKKNVQYFRLDGSTSGLEREKLIGDFNHNDTVRLFLVSTRAGSLGINLIGANRVIVFDASWNPCHDAQAVCRVYRYGQQKECQIYRFVTDLSLEKRIYDRQINKRGIADRVVDEMNPETQLNSKDVTSFLVLDQSHMDEVQMTQTEFDFKKFDDPVLRNVLKRCGNCLTKEPFEHESLLIDRKETKLSAKEKREARKEYEKEKKQAENQSAYVYHRPSYAAFYAKNDGASSYGSTSSVSQQYTSSSLNYYQNSTPSSSYASSSSYNNSGVTFKQKFCELKEQERRRHEQRSFPLQTLKQHGIDCRFMVLKKDAFIQDPSFGTEVFLAAGEKINIFRSKQGIYIQIANGRMIAIKPTSADVASTVRGIPLVGDVPQERLQSLVFSLLRPAKPSIPSNPYKHPRSSSGPTLYGNGVEKPRSFPPAFQKLPPTPGLFPSSYGRMSNCSEPTIGDDARASLERNQRWRHSIREKSARTATVTSSSLETDDDIQVIAFTSSSNSDSNGTVNGLGHSSSPLNRSNTSKNAKSFQDARVSLPGHLTPPDMSITPIDTTSAYGAQLPGTSDSTLGNAAITAEEVPQANFNWSRFKSLEQQLLDQPSDGTGTWLHPKSGVTKLKEVVASSAAKAHGSSEFSTRPTVSPSYCSSYPETLEGFGDEVSPVQLSNYRYRPSAPPTPAHPMQSLLNSFGNPITNPASTFQQQQSWLASLLGPFNKNGVASASSCENPTLNTDSLLDPAIQHAVEQDLSLGAGSYTTNSSHSSNSNGVDFDSYSLPQDNFLD